jgi:acyl-CoA synthetase (AMP-forming)/AMP-acid ligase II
MSTERYTVSGAPNFAYELCLRQSVPSDGLDLSGWELAFCGAEPIRASTVERFTAKLAPHGFQPRAFYACYGLAEATLLVTANARGSGATITAVDRAQQRRDVVAPTSDQDELRLVACGGPVDGMELLIVDPAERRALPSGSVGEIWLRGANVAVGYWRRPEETARDFGATLATAPPGGVTGPYLRTGDRGVVIDGQLYVAGRIKDMMIFHGQNHYPQDIEETVDRCHKALRAGCGAAFSVQHDGEERLVVVYELVEGAEATPDISTAVARAIWEDHGIPLFALSLIRKSTVPKTSSGKIMRSATRAAFQGGTLSAVASWTDLKEQR